MDTNGDRGQVRRAGTIAAFSMQVMRRADGSAPRDCRTHLESGQLWRVHRYFGPIGAAFDYLSRRDHRLDWIHVQTCIDAEWPTDPSNHFSVFSKLKGT
jgi:hypothetical protein